MSEENTQITPEPRPMKPGQPYESVAELAADMSDARYKGDSAKGVEADPEFVAYVLGRQNAPKEAAATVEIVPFANSEEQLEATMDPRYSSDAKYREMIRARIAVTDFSVAAISGRYSGEVQYDGAGEWYDTQDKRITDFTARHEAVVNASAGVEVPGLGFVTPYLSREEIVNDMKSKAYKSGDARTHALVQARLRISNF